MQLIADGLFLAALAPLLAIVAVVDRRDGRIPDAANAAIAALGAVRAGLAGPEALGFRALDAAILVLLLLLLRHVYAKRRGRHGLGLGDVKFLGAATLWIGLPGMLAMILAACLLALAEVGTERLRRRPVGWTTKLRFGPHLALALFAVLAIEAWL
jgi:leader peptidase (prepilin peptidase)/N-methyltransferase